MTMKWQKLIVSEHSQTSLTLEKNMQNNIKLKKDKKKCMVDK